MVHVKAGATSEWYTPKYLINSAMKVMGGIDLDPASCEVANETVGAVEFWGMYTIPGSLARPWPGRVWMNPPYSGYAGQANEWLAYMAGQYAAGNIWAGMALVQMSTLYQTGAQQLGWMGSICLLNHRVCFLDENGVEMKSPSQSHVVFYVGRDHAKFADVFHQHGLVTISANLVM